jgi:predicted transcriptional regulator
MSSKDLEPMSPSEWKVMTIIWEKKACAARDVYREAGDKHGWAPTTVKTMLRRLVAKGYLKTTQIGNSFLYQPTRPALRPLLRAADELLGRAMEGTVRPLLAHMVKKSQLSREDIADLRSLLDDVEPNEEG